MKILKGDFSITDNIDFTREIIFGRNDTKIISLDETNQAQLPMEHPNVIGGSSLLPPVDALIAEQEGNQIAYERIYEEMFVNNIEIDNFFASIFCLLMKGENILIYTPSLKENAVLKLIDILYKRYGISPGIIGQNPVFYDETCIPMWLRYVYLFNMMYAKDYIYFIPDASMITQDVMDRLLIDINPCGDSYKEKVEYILSLVKKTKEKPDLVIPIVQG